MLILYWCGRCSLRSDIDTYWVCVELGAIPIDLLLRLHYQATQTAFNVTGGWGATETKAIPSAGQASTEEFQAQG